VKLALATVAAVLLAGLANAKVAATTLAELAKRADQILVGKVVALHNPGGHRVAEVEVVRVIKGPPTLEAFFVLAEATWTCDISEAKKGETALFFLAPGEDFEASRGFWRALDRLRRGAPFFQIEWSGRGRMPLRQVDGVDFVTLWTSDVRLPKAIETVDGPEAEYASFIRSVRLDDILAEVEGQLRDRP
jgi:hypothetical protein